MRSFVAALISGLLASQIALSQLAVAGEGTAEPVTVDQEEAADVAAELTARAYSARLDVRSDADQRMQAYVDQMGTVAALLEAELRAGRQRSETEALYRELRRVRLEAISLAMSGAAELPEGAAELDALLDELGRYQRNGTLGASSEPAPGDTQP